jgi:hypothetical protein
MRPKPRPPTSAGIPSATRLQVLAWAAIAGTLPVDPERPLDPRPFGIAFSWSICPSGYRVESGISREVRFFKFCTILREHGIPLRAPRTIDPWNTPCTTGRNPDLPTMETGDARRTGKRPPMIEALMLWNEPNNLSHWDRELDPDWSIFAAMTRLAAEEIRATAPEVPLVLGGISPIDPSFLRLIRGHGLLDALDVIAIHGFPYDWNLWHAEEWPAKIDAIRSEFGKPVWVTEAGVSSWASETNMEWGLRRIAPLLKGAADRVHWYTLFDLAPERDATTRHGAAEGSAYWRHFHFGLLRADGSPKPALASFDPALGICQWIHFHDHDRLEGTVRWLRRLGVRHVRTGLSWAEWHQPGGPEWFDRLVEAFAPFQTTLTLCFTPPSLGIRPHHTSPPREIDDFAVFARWVADRYLAR